jgi:methionyl aminopeptidase
MIAERGWEADMLDDGWTAVTVDGSRVAQFEHTLVVTEDGVDILTRPA